MRTRRFWIALVLVALACGGATEEGDGKSKSSVVPGASGGAAGEAPIDDGELVEPPVPSECPATPPNGYEQCAVPADTPCTWIDDGAWTRCRCNGTWECEACAGCQCPADIPETGDWCEAYPGATPCPSSGVHGYCSCSPSLTWECSLEPGGVGGSGGWSGGGG